MYKLIFDQESAFVKTLVANIDLLASICSI